MKRALIVFSTLSLVLVAGCARRYEERLNATYLRLKYIQRLDKNLGGPAGEPFKALQIHIRPPRPLELTKFSLGETTGLYDGAASFADLKKGNDGLRLHVVARRVKDKKKTPAKNAPPEPDPTIRGDFQADLLTLLTTGFGNSETLAAPAWKDEKDRTNTFKRLIFQSPTNGNTVKVFVYKQAPYDVALIFDIPTAGSKDASANAIPLCLESFAVGAKAQRAFEGAVDDDSAAPPKAGAVGGGTGQAF